VAVAILAATAGCSAGAVGHVSAHRRGESTITVAAGGVCPASPGGAGDVRNAATPERRLLPDGKPTAGLVCVYRAFPAAGAPPGSTVRLARTVHLDAAQSAVLAGSIAKVSLKPAHGTFECPAAVAGAAIIALLYPPRRSVDLWYAASGCQTLDNGDVLAFQGANPSFYDGFETTFATLVGTR
jgi:hypothetical protein